MRVCIENSFFKLVEVPLSLATIWQLKTVSAAVMVLQVILTFCATQSAQQCYFN
ncbi:MAG: hypothetical protein ABF290_00115 [Thiogranum sp.]